MAAPTDNTKQQNAPLAPASGDGNPHPELKQQGLPLTPQNPQQGQTGYMGGQMGFPQQQGFQQQQQQWPQQPGMLQGQMGGIGMVYPQQQQQPGMGIGYPQQQQQPGMGIGYPQQQQQPGMGIGYPQQQQQPGMGMVYPQQQPWMQQPQMAGVGAGVSPSMDPAQAQAIMMAQQYPQQQQQQGFMGGIFPQHQQMGIMQPGMQQYPQAFPQQTVMASQQLQPQTGGYLLPTIIAPSTANMASLGYSETHIASQSAFHNAVGEMQIIVKALTNMNTDEKALIHVLSKHINPMELALIRQCYSNLEAERKMAGTKELIDVVNKKVINFSGGFKEIVHAIILGPVALDAYLLNLAMSGLGTSSRFLQLVLLGRSNADIHAIKAQYEANYKKSLSGTLKGEMSNAELHMFLTAIEAKKEWDDPTLASQNGSAWQDAVLRDCEQLRIAMTGDAAGARVAEILVTKSDLRIAAIAKNFPKVYPENSDEYKDVNLLEKKIKSKFSGGMETGLLYILNGVIDRPARDAALLAKVLDKPTATAFVEKIGKDQEIAFRIVKLVWGNCANPGYMREVKDAFFKLRFGGKPKELETAVKAGTSGDFEKMLLALLRG